MRKENSSFNAKFLSKTGTALHNNDYFGCSELEEFACYVVADGIKKNGVKLQDPSARLAVETVIAAFNANPSMSRRAVNSYLQAAHKVLIKDAQQRKLRATITVIITDYQALRYGYAGNCRFNLYRGAKLFNESFDHSLSWEMAENGIITKDKIAQHEERNNLSCFLGQPKTFTPQISAKIKLKDGDILSIFTRGIWENCDQNDLLAAFKAAENDPDASLENVERLLLDHNPLPFKIDNYTICTVFIDKVYVDAKKSKKIKLIIIISLIVIILVAVIVFLCIYFDKKHKKLVADMQTAYINGVEYIQDENFVRAKEEMDKALGFATDLKDNPKQTDISNFQKMIEAVMNADEQLAADSYESAQSAYLRARERSRFTDNLAADYINRKLTMTSDHINVHDLINLGDTLSDQNNYNLAEEKYLEARRLASKIYDADGKQQAIDALNALYEKMKATTDEHEVQAQSEVAAAEFIVQGDTAYKTGDLTGAKVYYESAKEKYAALKNDEVVADIDKKLALVADKEKENESKLKAANIYASAGDKLMEQKDYSAAKKQYILAREIFAAQKDEESLANVKAQIDIADSLIDKAKNKE